MKSSFVCVLCLLLSLSLMAGVESRRRRRYGGGGYRMQSDRHRAAGEARSWQDVFRHMSRGYRNGYYGNGYRRHLDWWDGPNVCRSMESDDDNQDGDVSTISHDHKSALQVCEESNTAYKCKTMIQSSEGKVTRVERYECCHGYTRRRGDFGCPREQQLKGIVATAQDLGLKDLLAAVTSVGLAETLVRGNFTVFAPVDGTFPLTTGPGLTLQSGGQEGSLRVLERLQASMERNLQALLLSHVLPEPARVSSFSDEQILETASPRDSTIRINFYSIPQKMTTANCVRVRSSDNMATNGVIHTVDKVLPSVTMSLMEIIQREDDFSFLKTVLGRTDLVSALQGEGQYTLLAPTNAAFQRLDRGLMDRLVRGDAKCLQKVLKQHLLPHVICSEVIQGRSKTPNVLHNYINLTRTEDDKVFVDDAQVVRADVMGTNGVLHVIDTVLVPDDALDLVSVANKAGLTELLKLVTAAGLTSTLQAAENITVLAPSNQAIQALSPSLVDQLTRGDTGLLRYMLTYHVLPEEVTGRQLFNSDMLSTLAGNQDVPQIRVNQYTTFPFGNRHSVTADCASIITYNVAACNAIVHVIDKVLLPPTGRVMDVLTANSSYSTLVSLIKTAGLAEALEAEGPFTVFAPTNEAFAKLDRRTLQTLQNDLEQLATVLQLHVFQGNLCSAGIFRTPWWSKQRVQALSGQTLFLSRDHDNQPTVNGVLITSADVVATNGVVHGVDSVLMAQPKPWYMFP